MRLRQETQLAVQRQSWTSTYTTTLRLYPNTTRNKPSVHQSETYNGDTSYPIILYHHISIASRANKKMIIKPQQRHQSISTARAHQNMIPTMAGSRTYGGPAYYDSHLPVTSTVNVFQKIKFTCPGSSNIMGTIHTQENGHKWVCHSIMI